ncbi:hypothetical protein FE633_41840, partial [Streptomyces montanus]
MSNSQCETYGPAYGSYMLYAVEEPSDPRDLMEWMDPQRPLNTYVPLETCGPLDTYGSPDTYRPAYEKPRPESQPESQQLRRTPPKAGAPRATGGRAEARRAARRRKAA